jgi:hypothetical protein
MQCSCTIIYLCTPGVKIQVKIPTNLKPQTFPFITPNNINPHPFPPYDKGKCYGCVNCMPDLGN